MDTNGRDGARFIDAVDFSAAALISRNLQAQGWEKRGPRPQSLLNSVAWAAPQLQPFRCADGRNWQFDEKGSLAVHDFIPILDFGAGFCRLWPDLDYRTPRCTCTGFWSQSNIICKISHAYFISGFG